MNLQEVNVTTIETEADKSVFDKSYRICAFCDKIVRVCSQNFQSCDKLSGNKFYCPFCIRHSHNFRSSREILPMSFRGIIGFLYYRYYDANPRTLYLGQLESMIESHHTIGSNNPAFSYDPANFMWYLDFNKIGNHSRKAPFDEIKLTTKLIFDVFDLKHYLNLQKEEVLYSRFEKAMSLFYEQRIRPTDRRLLIPTLNGIVSSKNNEEFFETTRNFTKSSMIII
jgi:hypothetical protein